MFSLVGANPGLERPVAKSKWLQHGRKARVGSASSASGDFPGQRSAPAQRVPGSRPVSGGILQAENIPTPKNIPGQTKDTKQNAKFCTPGENHLRDGMRFEPGQHGEPAFHGGWRK